MLISFDGVIRPVAFENCPEIPEILAAVLKGWRFRRVEAGEAEIFVERTADGYRLDAPWFDEPVLRRSPVTLVTQLMIDLTQVHVDDSPSRLAVHCAAAAFAGRLVLLPGETLAGKSTMAAGLAARGFPVFTDDVLPIAPCGRVAMALGVPPRLRLPLPETLPLTFHDFVAARANVADEDFAYIDPPSAARVEYGREGEIGAVVVLERKEDGPVDLLPSSPGHGLHYLFLQNFARDMPADAVIDMLRDIVGRVPAYVLRYSALDEAIDRLASHFSAWPPPAPGHGGALDRFRFSPNRSNGPSCCSAALASGEPVSASPGTALETGGDNAGPTVPGPAPLLSGRFVRRDRDVTLHEVGSEAFLSTANGSVYRMNPMGAALWRLLEMPAEGRELVEAFGEAFPGVERERLAADIAALLAELEANRLVRHTV